MCTATLLGSPCADTTASADGCNVDLGGGYSHPVCQLNAEFHPTSGKSGPYKNHGRWHDAGDYGRYIVNSGISTGTLLRTWEMFNGAVRNLDLKIPESGGKLPNFLAEILESRLDAQPAKTPTAGYGTSRRERIFAVLSCRKTIIWSALSLAPDRLRTRRLRDRRSGCGGGDCRLLLRTFRRRLCQKQHGVSETGTRMGQQNPNVGFRNSEGVRTGDYGDTDCRDELLWAAAEL
jgi:endoglucanase